MIVIFFEKNITILSELSGRIQITLSELSGKMQYRLREISG